ncbi:MAG TPA: transcriptional regulator GcvA [Alphaproteobacteria bacterium]|nr:transcriptional regulator GcvA [Alphaproteobacteria bacterium]
MPSLNALRAFWAAAKHRSFAAAAAELHVTASAVSLQIRQLEDELELKLFERTPKGLVLTADGAKLLPGINLAFENLRSSIAALEDQAERVARLRISVAPSFATKWLLPRLGNFLDRHPEVEVDVKASIELTDFARDEVDLAIRYGAGNYPGLAVELLLRDRMFPVCSPELLMRFGHRDPANDPSRVFASATLLHDASTDRDPAVPSWKMWLKAAGLGEVDWRKGPRFNQTALALDAALAGLGIALAPAVLIEADLAAGRLVRLASDELPGDFAYYLVHPQEKGALASLRHFKDWLRAAL